LIRLEIFHNGLCKFVGFSGEPESGKGHCEVDAFFSVVDARVSLFYRELGQPIGYAFCDGGPEGI
jgi:hypothetical protein